MNYYEIILVILFWVSVIGGSIAWTVIYVESKKRKSKLEADKFFSLSKQYSPRKVVKLKEPTKQGEEWTLEPASESMSYSLSPSPSPSPELPPEYPPASGVLLVGDVSPSMFPTYAVPSGTPYPGFFNKRKIVDESCCPYCHQKKDLTKNYCPHCGVSYGN